jgi:hypothetical protein
MNSAVDGTIDVDRVQDRPTRVREADAQIDELAPCWSAAAVGCLEGRTASDWPLIPIDLHTRKASSAGAIWSPISRMQRYIIPAIHDSIEALERQNRSHRWTTSSAIGAR